MQSSIISLPVGFCENEKLEREKILNCASNVTDSALALNIWVVPGMVDPGEFLTTTLRREFAEEALDLEGADEETKHAIEKRIDKAFANEQEVR